MLKIIMFAILVSPMISCATNMPVHVVISKGGDDGLTNRLFDKIKEGLEPPGSMVGKRGNSKLAIHIMNHVGWEEKGTDTEITYDVRLTVENAAASFDKQFLLIHGGCMESQLNDCAVKIIRDANEFIR